MSVWYHVRRLQAWGIPKEFVQPIVIMDMVPPYKDLYSAQEVILKFAGTF